MAPRGRTGCSAGGRCRPEPQGHKRGQHLGQRSGPAGLSLESPRRTRRRKTQGGGERTEGRGVSPEPWPLVSAGESHLGALAPIPAPPPTRLPQQMPLGFPKRRRPHLTIGRREASGHSWLTGCAGSRPGRRHRVPSLPPLSPCHGRMEAFAALTLCGNVRTTPNGAFAKHHRCDELSPSPGPAWAVPAHRPLLPAPGPRPGPWPPRLEPQRVSKSSSCAPSLLPREPVSRPPLATRMRVLGGGRSRVTAQEHGDGSLRKRKVTRAQERACGGCWLCGQDNGRLLAQTAPSLNHVSVNAHTAGDNRNRDGSTGGLPSSPELGTVRDHGPGLAPACQARVEKQGQGATPAGPAGGACRVTHCHHGPWPCPASPGTISLR